MEIIASPNAPKAIGPYSQAVKANGVIYVSGQIPLSPFTLSIQANNIEGQTKQVIENVQAILLAADSDLSKVVKTTCYLANIRDFATFNAIYEGYFVNKPARVCVEVSALPKGALLEMDVIALE